MRGIPEATVIILMAEERAELEGLARIRHLAVFILRILAVPTQSRGVRDSKGALHHVRSTRPGFS